MSGAPKTFVRMFMPRFAALVEAGAKPADGAPYTGADAESGRCDQPAGVDWQTVSVETTCIA